MTALAPDPCHSGKKNHFGRTESLPISIVVRSEDFHGFVFGVVLDREATGSS